MRRWVVISFVLDKCDSVQQGRVVDCSEKDCESLVSAIRWDKRLMASQEARRSVGMQ
jgi:hypothetical protein